MEKEKTLTKRERAIQRANEKKRRRKRLTSIILPIIAVVLAVGIVVLIVSLTKDDAPVAEISIRDYGTVKIRLDKENAPKTVERFVKLAKEGFYDGLPFYSLVDGKIYSGDPDANGKGGYKSSIFGEFSQNGASNSLSHKKGVISLDREVDYNSGTSRFFILTKDHTELDGSYAAFGTVTKGLNIIEKIANEIKADENGFIPSESQPLIEKITIKD